LTPQSGHPADGLGCPKSATTDIMDLSDANKSGRQLWDLKHADPADFAKAVPGEEAIGWL
jgi:hypothetical protein